jgi:hypothetical protein
MVLHQQPPLGHAYRIVDEGVLSISRIRDARPSRRTRR